MILTRTLARLDSRWVVFEVVIGKLKGSLELLPLPAKDFADTTMADPKLPGDIARPDTLMSKFHYPLADYIRKWPSIHKNPPKLIHSSMS